MANQIAYAKVKYYNTVSNKWIETTINRRSNQSDRGFIRSIKKLLQAHTKKTITQMVKKDITLDKQGVKFFNMQEEEIYV